MAGQLETGDEEDVIAQINIIPFVDIALVLLIIFLCTSSIIARGAFEVDLPKAAAAGDAVDSTANVVLATDGATYLNGNAVSAEELRSRIAEEARAHPQLRAVIAADQSVSYARLINAIDLVKQGGVTAFALNVEKGSPPQP